MPSADTAANASATWTGRVVSENRRLMPSSHGRLINSSGYRVFLSGMAYALRTQIQPMQSPVDVVLTCKLHCARDTDSIIKAAIDAIVLAGILPNDNGNNVHDIRVLRQFHPKGAEDEIRWTLARNKGLPF